MRQKVEYYYEIKKPRQFRHHIISSVKETILIQGTEEKMNLIRNAKNELLKQITQNIKEIKNQIEQIEKQTIDETILNETRKTINKPTQTKKQTKKIIEEIQTTKTTTKKTNDLDYTLDAIEKKLKELQIN